MTAFPAYLPALGIVSALGAGRSEVAANLFAGRNEGMRRRDDLLADGQPATVGEVASPLPDVPDHLRAYESRNLQLIIAAAEQIRPEIEAALSRYGTARIGVVMGSSTSGIDRGEAALAVYEKSGSLPPGFDIRMQELGSVGEALAKYLGIEGPAYTVSTACSSGAHALAAGRRMLQTGLVDAVVAGGADTLCRLTVNGFQALSALSLDLCNPFSRNRAGINIGEGAAIFLMQKEESEVALWGTGTSSDGYSMTAPDPEGTGIEIALRAALADAKVEPKEIDYVQLHGTGTAQNDLVESAVIKRLFKGEIPASSSKAQIGHTLGAAGAMGAAHCWLAAHSANTEGYLPPHLWDGMADDGLLSESLVSPGEVLAPSARRLFLSNTLAFGGNNAGLVLGRQP
jgi:3-oxoacyl-[acyl-carrier-protein] synthase-1